MSGPAGIKDVAAHAGVSVGTVSNVLNRPHLVRPETRERVETAMADLGFVRNESARQLRAGSSRIVAFVFTDTSNPFFADVARGAEEACRESDLALVMCNSDGDPAREEDYLSLLLEQRVHGVMIATSDAGGTRLRSLPGLGIPVVLVDSGESSTSVWCSVGVNDAAGGELAVAHLIERGHRRIAFIGGPAGVPQLRDRLTGVHRALESADLPPDRLTTIETPATTVGAGRDGGRHLLGLPASTRPTAVFCGNDLVALGLLQELTRHGARVPDDVAIVGYDDIDFAASAAVPLTSVRQPRYLLGRTAARLLLRESEARGHHRHEYVRFEPELVVRQSSGG
ncbi:MAG: LacI family transcriptional regulator [Actinomycetota bacterium]|nr:LacI family transcriptional regulator [Actinomycetota bacterium]